MNARAKGALPERPAPAGLEVTCGTHLLPRALRGETWLATP
jgi:hypothetical protein